SPAPIAAQEQTATYRVDGLTAQVEIFKDRWGISHIYAETEEDLFFAQGYNAARDRLFQLELWRRQTNGTVAEILGERELQRDIGTRLFLFRGDMRQEMNHYHPRGESIITSYVRGVNAYIAETERDPELLPLEFELLGIRPGRWTPETVISRHQGLLGNIGTELDIARAVATLGADKVKKLRSFSPADPNLEMDPVIDRELLFDDILGVYNAFRRPVLFMPEDLAEEYRADSDQPQLLDAPTEPFNELQAFGPEDIGSNNWVVSGDLTQNGFPFMANDPHRAQSAPSLRYWVHLVGPGWNVIGGGEPEIPGVSIGHNGYGAWGLTVFRTDGEDLYVYETNPGNPNEYRYRDHWETMTVLQETIPVKGRAPELVDLKYTRHGPVVYEDQANNVAYAVRAAWMEVGGAPYLASLRMDQAQSWEKFREACNYSNIPGENMVWADRDGNIGWQAVGIAPVRRTWSGLVPVPGDGRYEWDGYLPINAKPNIFNPPNGFFATANNDLVPHDYPHHDATGYLWSDPSRWARLNEVLGSGRVFSMADMMALQTDLVSLPARTLVPMLRYLNVIDSQVERARSLLMDWDYALHANSVAAGIYVAWERRLSQNMSDLFVPSEAREHLRSYGMQKIIDQLVAPGAEFGADPIAGRDSILLASLEQAVDDLRQKLGANMDRWQYGQEAYKHVYISHPLSGALDDEMRRRFDVGPAPRGGYSYTVNATGSGDNQTSGASFRIIVNTGDWDTSVGSNTPGQSGDPGNRHYSDLFDLWANDRFFPVFYSRDKIEAVADERVLLIQR
ncbi:penicillin acylase family protein, partial [Gemmatimonadota bacterium]